MVTYSTRQVAKKLGITDVALGHYIKVGKIPAPKIMAVGNRNVHAWTEEEIEHVRKLLPKIANGRKTRYQKLREKQKAQARAPRPRQAKRLSGAPMPVPHKKGQTKKKKKTS